jgi:hypothetical protein
MKKDHQEEYSKFSGVWMQISCNSDGIDNPVENYEDRLAFCAANEGMKRPTGFESKIGHTLRFFKCSYETDLTHSACMHGEIPSAN